MSTGTNISAGQQERVYIYSNPSPPTALCLEHIAPHHEPIHIHNTSDSPFDGIDPHAPACCIAEFSLRKPHTNYLPARVAELGLAIPIIFLVPPADVRAAVRALHAGAFDALESDTPTTLLLDSISHAIQSHRNFIDSHQPVIDRLRRLSPREREILDLVVAGNATRQIAEIADRREKTIEFHRRNIMRKMEAANVAHLVRMIISLPKHRHHTE